MDGMEEDAGRAPDGGWGALGAGPAPAGWAALDAALEAAGFRPCWQPGPLGRWGLGRWAWRAGAARGTWLPGGAGTGGHPDWLHVPMDGGGPSEDGEDGGGAVLTVGGRDAGAEEAEESAWPATVEGIWAGLAAERTRGTALEGGARVPDARGWEARAVEAHETSGGRAGAWRSSATRGGAGLLCAEVEGLDRDGVSHAVHVAFEVGEAMHGAAVEAEASGDWDVGGSLASRERYWLVRTCLGRVVAEERFEPGTGPGALMWAAAAA